MLVKVWSILPYKTKDLGRGSSKFDSILKTFLANIIILLNVLINNINYIKAIKDILENYINY